jgi:hypothetical protein
MLALSSGRRSFAVATLALLAAACTKSTGGGGGGGPVSGPADMHCVGVPVQSTSQADCHLTASADAGAGTGGGATSDYGATMYDSQGDDDDCKYHVAWTSTPIAENSNVTFTVVATNLGDGTPLTGPGATTGVGAGANVLAEVYLSDIHPAPNTNQMADETSPGTYTVGPIQFDAPGKWTVRFHFFEDCSDIAADSPHGHAAFYVDVP